MPNGHDSWVSAFRSSSKVPAHASVGWDLPRSLSVVWNKGYFPQVLLPHFPGVFMDAGGGQGLQQLQHQQKVLLLFLCMSIVTDALWGQKQILTLVFRAFVYTSLHLGTPFPCCVNTCVSYRALSVTILCNHPVLGDHREEKCVFNLQKPQCIVKTMVLKF